MKYAIALLALVIALIQAKKIIFLQNGKYGIRWVPLITATLIIVVAILVFYQDSRNDKEHKVDIQQIKDSFAVQSNNYQKIIDNQQAAEEQKAAEMKRDSIYYDVERKRYYKALPGQTTVGINWKRLKFLEVSKDSFEIEIPIINHGLVDAFDLKVQVFGLTKFGDRFEGVPCSIGDNWKNPREIPSKYSLGNSGTFKALYPVRETDTMFFRVRYHWSNPSKRLKEPKTEYIFWSKSYGFRYADDFMIAEINDQLKKAGIK